MCSRTHSGRRILIIEDDRDIAQLVALHLRDLGCQVEEAHDGADGLQRATAEAYDLIILDLLLPGLEGLEVCRRLRAGPDYTPILMLTARSGEVDRVVGLEMGADDYLAKPFSVQELAARVKALFRRIEAIRMQEQPAAPAEIEVGDLHIDVEKRTVRVAGREVQTTAKEFDLLLLFATHPGRVYTRAQLLDAVWGYGHAGYEHTVNSHINRLRGKIEEDSSRPRYLLTVWGVGYKFFEPEIA